MWFCAAEMLIVKKNRPENLQALTNRNFGLTTAPAVKFTATTPNCMVIHPVVVETSQSEGVESCNRDKIPLETVLIKMKCTDIMTSYTLC